MDQLLLYCLGVVNDATRSVELEHLSDADWEALLQLARRQGVAPLLYWRFKTASPGPNVPHNVVQELREAFLLCATRNVRLYHDLTQVLTALQDMPVIVLKGAHLAKVVYDNIALRPMDDVDLLVRETDLASIEKKLLGIGYMRSGTKRLVVSHHLPAFIKPDAVTIEVHKTIVRLIDDYKNQHDPFKIDIDEIWAGARAATIAGVKTLVLSPTDLLLHLCLHTSYHHRFGIGLRAFCDIAATIRHYGDEMDWEQLQLAAHRWRAKRYVYLTLYLARELLEAPVPEKVLNVLEPDDVVPRLVAWAKEQAFADTGNSPPIRNLARVWEARRLQDKVSAYIKAVFPSPQAMTLLYSLPPRSNRVYLYYPVRLKDLLFKYGRIAWRMLRHDKEALTLVTREGKTNALMDWLALD
jgi:hypothetical protein